MSLKSPRGHRVKGRPPVWDRWILKKYAYGQVELLCTCPVGQVEIQRHRHSYRGSGQVNLGDGQVDLHSHFSDRTDDLKS